MAKSKRKTSMVSYYKMHILTHCIGLALVVLTEKINKNENEGREFQTGSRVTIKRALCVHIFIASRWHKP